MFTSFVILILFVLSSQVFPVALGIDFGKNKGYAIWYGLILVFGQILFLLFGLFLGDRFMHLVEGFKGIVIFVGFFLIGIRLLMDTFKVRKGERTYSIESTLPVVLASSAQGINTFLAGLLFTTLALDANWLLVDLLALTCVMTGISLFLKPTKQSFTLSSLLFALGGLIMIVASIYFGFII
jgi:hypothetical protein